MHLDEEQVERLLHGELAPRTEAGVREHLADCAACRTRIATADREEKEVYALLHHLDGPSPRVDARTVAGAAAPGRGFRWGRWAAGVIVALGLGGASYALPGSPIPSLVRAVVQWAGGLSDRPRPTSAPATESAPAPVPAPSVAGIAVPVGRDLIIVFTSALGQARVSLTDGAEVVVRAPAGAATFTAHVDRLVIENAGAGTVFDIGIPRGAPRIEIRVEERCLFLKDGHRIVSEPPVASIGTAPLDTPDEGPYLLRLAPPDR